MKTLFGILGRRYGVVLRFKAWEALFWAFIALVLLILAIYVGPALLAGRQDAKNLEKALESARLAVECAQ